MPVNQTDKYRVSGALFLLDPCGIGADYDEYDGIATELCEAAAIEIVRAVFDKHLIKCQVIRERIIRLIGM